MMKKAGIGLLALLMLVLSAAGAQAVTEADYAASSATTHTVSWPLPIFMTLSIV